MDGFQTDDDDEDGSGFDKEMGVDGDDGDEADAITLRKLAEQVLISSSLHAINEFKCMLLCFRCNIGNNSSS